MPAMPQKLAGWRIEPPVSVPWRPSPAAPPPPPPSRRRSRRAPARASLPWRCPRDWSPARRPRSCWTSPWRTRPDSPCRGTPRRRAAGWRSRCFRTAARRLPRIRLPAVVRTPSVQNRSLIAERDAGQRPAPRRAPAPRRPPPPGASASSGVTVMKAFSRGFSAVDRVEMRLGQFARGEIPRAAAPSRASAIVRSVKHHSTTFGTAKKSPARSGALASTCSAMPPSVTTSSRIAAPSARRRSAARRPRHRPRRVARSSPGCRSARPAAAAAASSSTRMRASLAMRRTVAGSSDIDVLLWLREGGGTITARHAPVQHDASCARRTAPPGQRLLGLDPGSRSDRRGAVGRRRCMLASPYGELRARQARRQRRRDRRASRAARVPAGWWSVCRCRWTAALGPAAQAARDWAHALSAATGLPAALWDERLSSARRQPLPDRRGRPEPAAPRASWSTGWRQPICCRRRWMPAKEGQGDP